MNGLVVIKLILILISLGVLTGHLLKSYNSRQKLKDLEEQAKNKSDSRNNIRKQAVYTYQGNQQDNVCNDKKNEHSDAVRVLTNKEKLYLTPYLSVHQLSLVSDDVYQLTDAEISVEGYRINQTTILKIRADGIDIFFPYTLSKAVEDENTIEYAILKGSMRMVAVVISINGVTLSDIGKEVWDENSEGQPLEKVLEKRLETATEFRLRMSKLLYIPTAVSFTFSLIALFIAILVKTSTAFLVFLGIAGFFCLLMLIMAYRTKKIAQKPREIQVVKGVFANIPVQSLDNAEIINFVSFVGPSHPLVIDDNLLKNNEDNNSSLSHIRAELVYLPEQKRYELMSSSATKSIDEVYKDSMPRPKSRLVIFTVLAFIGTLVGIVCQEKDINNTIFYAVNYFPNPNQHTYADLSNVINQPVKRWDKINLSGVGAEPIIKFKNGDSNPYIDKNTIQLGANEQLIVPEKNGVLTELGEGKFFTFKQYNRLIIIHSFELIMRLKEKANNNPLLPDVTNYRSMRAHHIINTNRLLELLEQACRENKLSCDSLYNDLSYYFSDDKNFYLNNMDDYYGETLTADKMKEIIQKGDFWLEENTYSSMLNKIKKWADDGFKNSLNKSQFTNIDVNRGGVIFESKDIVNDIFSSLPKHIAKYTTSYNFTDISYDVANLRKQPYEISGLVANIKEEDGIKIIQLAQPYDRLSRQSLACLLMMAFSSLIFVLAFISWLFPPRFTKVSRNMRKQKINSVIS